jgi:hypothetical protein
MLFYKILVLFLYDTLQNMTGSHNTILYDEDDISGGIGCDEAGVGVTWV